MKQKVFIVILLLFAAFSFSMKIGIYYNPPKIIDSKTGIFPEILNYIFDKEQIEYKYVFDTFPNLIKKLDNGEIDAIASVGYSSERAEKYDYNNETFLSDWAVIYINHNENIKNIFDLKNKKIGVLKNDIYYEDDIYGIKKILENFGVKAELIEFYSYEGIFKALSEKKIDAGVVNRTFGLFNFEKYNVVPTDIVFSPIKVLIMFRKGYRDKEKIIRVIDEYLKALKENKNSLYYEIINKYLFVEKVENVPWWVKIAIILSVIVVLALMLNSYILRKMVEKRTKELKKLNMILSVKNEELESLYIHNEQLQNSLKLLIKIMSDIGNVDFISEDDFIIRLLETLKFIIPGFKYEKIVKKEEDKSTVILEFENEESNIKKLDMFLEISDKLKYQVTFVIDKSPEDIKGFLEIIESFKILAKAFYKMKNEAKIEETLREDIIRALITFLEQHDEYTKNHSKNVAELSAEIAKKMNLSDSFIRKVYLTGLLHDIGKLLMPLEILNKKGSLNEDEYNIIKKHPLIGYNALIKTESLKEIAIGVKHHHERWDGKGYPDGLKGEEIPLMSQIIAVADAWDAMISKRAYRNPLGYKKAVEEIIKNSGKQFSPEIVKVFLEIIKEEK